MVRLISLLKVIVTSFGENDQIKWVYKNFMFVTCS